MVKKKHKATKEEIEKFLEDNNISGIIKYCDSGIISLYSNHGIFLEIMDYANIEMSVYERKKQSMVEDEIAIMKMIGKDSRPIPTYIK